jgi:hypothetical protein
MLDLAWQDFKTYHDPEESEPLGLAVILIGKDPEGSMTIKTGATAPPHVVEMALLQLVMGFATGEMKFQKLPKIKRKRVI